MIRDETAGDVGLEQIRAVMAELPGPDLDAGTAALTRNVLLERSIGGCMGKLGEQVEWLATWQGRHPPLLRRPRTAVFAGNHGFAAHLEQPGGGESAASFVQTSVDGAAAVNGACTIADADLRVFEMSLETPTADATTQPAMDQEECARAVAYGMMAVEQGLDLLCLDVVGAGGETAAAALSHALFGGSPRDWLASSSGGDAAPEATLVERLANLHRGQGDAFESLRRLAGFEMCAVVGAVLAARVARTPVVLGGYAATAAAGVLFALDSRSLDHCRAAQSPPQGGGHSGLVERLGLRPLMGSGSALGAGTEATLAVPILKAAVEIHAGMAPPLR